MSRLKFDIKFRPQIESGEYKVETEAGSPAKVMDWEYNSRVCGKCIAIKITEGDGDQGRLYTHEGKRASILPAEEGSDLFIITPEPELSEFEVRMQEIRSLYVAMQEQGVDDRYGDALSANLPRMIKWLTDKIELAKREREFSKAVHTGPQELTPFENGVLKMIDAIAKCITYPNDSCIPNVRTVASELLALAEREIINRVAKECYKEGFCIEDTVKFDEGYKLGKEVALKDLPRWREGLPPGKTALVVSGYDFICVNNKLLKLSSLEKLTGFKEDEK